MEKSEPTLVPEWLRSTGNSTGAGSLAHNSTFSSSQTDTLSLANSARNRSSRSISDFNRPRPAFLDRSSSSNSRRISSTNGSSKNPYSSFSRSHREKDRDREKERSAVLNHWDHDGFDILGKDKLRRSHSMVTEKQDDLFSRNGGNSHNGNCVLSGGSVGSRIQKATFEKDFPSLVADEKHGMHDVGRASSPGLTTPAQSLPVGNSVLKGGEGWSVLAEVPMVIGGNNIGPSSAHQLAATPEASSSVASLNMAEALAQAPSRARNAPQLTIETQRREELLIKHSRVLIPMTPSVPKASVLNSSDKSKPKTLVRSGEIIGATKSGQQQLPSLLNPSGQSPRGVNGRSDAIKTPQSGKFLVLKPAWENGTSPSAKDVSSPSSNAASSLLAGSSAPTRNANNPKVSTAERKAAALPLNLVSTVEKKPSSSQAKSRNDFFNSVRKKSSANSVLSDSNPAISSPTMEKFGEAIEEVTSSPASPQLVNGNNFVSNGNTPEEGQKFSDFEGKNSGTIEALSPVPDEEEAAFLRSLGWEENAGEDEGLTEEEINEFYQLHMKRLSLKTCEGMQLKFSMLAGSRG